MTLAAVDVEVRYDTRTAVRATTLVLEPGQLNTYDVLCSDEVVFTQGAFDAFVAGPATGKSGKGAATSDEEAV